MHLFKILLEKNKNQKNPQSPLRRTNVPNIEVKGHFVPKSLSKRTRLTHNGLLGLPGPPKWSVNIEITEKIQLHTTVQYWLYGMKTMTTSTSPANTSDAASGLERPYLDRVTRHSR